MEQVTGAVPVGCEYALCYRWSKEAEAVFSDEERLLPGEIHQKVSIRRLAVVDETRDRLHQLLD